MKIKFAKQWDAVSQLWKKFYPITITSAVVDADRGQRLNATLADIYSALFYEDIYVGAATQSTTIKTSTYHHDKLVKGDLVSVTANSQKIWLIIPNDSKVPNIFMSGVEVSMVLHGTTTIDEATYKVYKSSSPFTGTFNIQLF